jgi:hypothetical protein
MSPASLVSKSKPSKKRNSRTQLADYFYWFIAYLNFRPSIWRQCVLPKRRNISQARNKAAKLSLPTPSTGLLLILLFDPQYGGSVFFWNVEVSAKQETRQPNSACQLLLLVYFLSKFSTLTTKAVCSSETSFFFPNYTALQPIRPQYLIVPAVGTSNPTLKRLVSTQIESVLWTICQVDERCVVTLFKRVAEQVSIAAML